MDSDRSQNEAEEQSLSQNFGSVSPVIPQHNSKSSCYRFEHEAFWPSESRNNNNIRESEVDSFQNEPLTGKKWKSVKDNKPSGGSPNDHKQEKNVYYGSTFESLSNLTKEKIQLGDEGFQAPELTTESVMSSEQFEGESSQNGNQLPISSASRFKNGRIFHEQSQGSDDMLENDQNRRIYHLKHNYAESKQSDPFESDDILTICEHCTSLFDKCKKLEAENGEIVKENLILNDQLAIYEQSGKQKLMGESSNFQFFRQQETSPSIIKELFLFQMEESYKTLLKVNQFLSSYEIDFSEKDCQYLEKFWFQFKDIENTVLGKEARQQKKLQIEQIHSNYKKLIKKLIKKIEEKQSKKESDFKKIMAVISSKPSQEIKPPFLTHAKVQRHAKKSKTFSQKQSLTDESFRRALQEQGRQKIQQLELNYQCEKEKCKQLQIDRNEQKQRFILQINEITKENIAYKYQLDQCSRQFADAFSKLCRYKQKIEQKNFVESQFFRNLSQRIFQISNCIPFEDNDEQNLFAPENQTQLYEMIERIRKFYLKFEQYNNSRDCHFQAERDLFIDFMKNFIEQSKAFDNHVLDMLQNKKYDNLSYIREFIHSSRSKTRRYSILRDSRARRPSQNKDKAQSFNCQVRSPINQSLIEHQ